jgi:hypothetical protein
VVTAELAARYSSPNNLGAEPYQLNAPGASLEAPALSGNRGTDRKRPCLPGTIDLEPKVDDRVWRLTSVEPGCRLE